ncbi:NRDE family protein [Flagellimonas algicola]|uniref:NRDE family protein n=1 Tax=Flagellimonas algicola TaxID=2583815 RepID=A0ABY2WHU2_9FLAO|nr:NRDE family protein [Allomuricauda algicola]TMU50886.1 NRDE family protein [Allomuricauda algicola]
MCTVSYISRQGRCFITSNRDEHISRPIALEPGEQIVNSVKLLFPKDPQAGGTWFAINEFGVVAVLLNGAFVNHERKLPYVRSRGLILLDVIANSEPQVVLQTMELKQVEPFTLVLYDGADLLELRWDGEKKHLKQLDAGKDHIWSSVTLYDDEAIARRESLFDEFISTTKEITESKIVDFHSNNHQDFENGFVIDRNTGLKTFSVTQMVLDQDQMAMQHFDLLNDRKYYIPFSPKTLETSK